MADFVDPFSALSSGFSQGANLALTMDQARQQRREREHELDLKQATMGLQMAAQKGLSAEARSEYFKPVSNYYKKYQGMEIKPPTPQNIGKFDEVLKRGKALVMAVQKGDVDASVALTDWGSDIARFQNENDFDEAIVKEANETVKKSIQMKGENKKGGTHPFILEQFATKELGMSQDGFKRILEKYPDLANVPFDQLKELAMGGPKQLPAPQVIQVEEGRTVSKLIPNIALTIKNNKDVFGPVSGSARSLNPYDTKAKAIDAQMRTGSQAFGRFMEGGVLRKEDEEKYRKMFPQLTDTPAVATKKLSIVKDLLTKKFEGVRGALSQSGYDMTGFEDGGDGNADPLGLR